MNASEKRTARFDAAFETVMERLCPKDPEGSISKLRNRFPTPQTAMESAPELITDLGFTSAQALLLNSVPALARRTGADMFGKRPNLSTLNAMSAYISTRFVGYQVEHFYVFALDKHGKLIEARLLQRGTTDSAPFYIRDILQLAVLKRVHALVIAHNHPNNTMRPSEGDIRCTLNLIEALQQIDIPLLDHIVVVNKKCVSIREYGLVYETIWQEQSPGNALVKNWLKGREGI